MRSSGDSQKKADVEGHHYATLRWVVDEWLILVGVLATLSTVGQLGTK